jgi:hypothetical protein
MATDEGLKNFGKLFGLFLIGIGFVVSVVMSFQALNAVDTRQIGCLGFVIVGVAVQLFGLGIIVLSLKNS